MPRMIRKTLREAGLGPLADSVESGMDVVGDIAIHRLGSLTRDSKKEVGAAFLKALPSVKVVCEQLGGIEGDYRLRNLAWVAGEERTLTVHRENGCQYKVDVAKCYFSPRLSTERLRVAMDVSPEEQVLNMFAGVGPFTIPIAKKKMARVTSWELNEYACGLHEENDRTNKVADLVDVVNGDAAELPGTDPRRYDRILMPHPSKSNEFLGAALQMAKGRAVIHYYRHVLGKDEPEARQNLTGELADLLPRRARFVVRRVREVGPRWLEMAADISLGA